MRALGLVGVGNLGLQLARKLTQHFKLYAFDADPARLSQLHDAHLASSLTDVARHVVRHAPSALPPTIISIVPNDQSLRDVSHELLTVFQGDARALHISCSTVSPHTSRQLAETHKAAGVDFVAAPIFARPENMRDGQASFVMSGDVDALDVAETVLLSAAPRQRIFRFGDDPGAANVVKLTGNFFIGASINVMAEGLALAEANGVDRNEVMNMLRSTIFDCAIFNGYGVRVAQRDHRPGGFALEHGLKDANLILDTAHRAGQPLAFGSVYCSVFECTRRCSSVILTQVMRDRFLKAAVSGHTDLDWSAVGLQPSIDGGRDISSAIEYARGEPATR